MGEPNAVNGPAGPAATIGADSVPDANNGFKTIIVKPGQTFIGLAKEHDIDDWRDIMRFNGLNKPSDLMAGMKLKIPIELPVPEALVGSSVGAGQTEAEPAPDFITIKVKPGQTFVGLAKEHDIDDWRDIMRFNGLKKPSDLKAGMKLKILVAPSDEPVPTAPAQGNTPQVIAPPEKSETGPLPKSKTEPVPQVTPPEMGAPDTNVEPVQSHAPVTAPVPEQEDHAQTVNLLKNAFDMLVDAGAPDNILVGYKFKFMGMDIVYLLATPTGRMPRDGVLDTMQDATHFFKITDKTGEERIFTFDFQGDIEGGAPGFKTVKVQNLLDKMASGAGGSELAEKLDGKLPGVVKNGLLFSNYRQGVDLDSNPQETEVVVGRLTVGMLWPRPIVAKEIRGTEKGKVALEGIDKASVAVKKLVTRLMVQNMPKIMEAMGGKGAGKVAEVLGEVNEAKVTKLNPGKVVAEKVVEAGLKIAVKKAMESAVMMMGVNYNVAAVGQIGGELGQLEWKGNIDSKRVEEIATTIADGAPDPSTVTEMDSSDAIAWVIDGAGTALGEGAARFKIEADKFDHAEQFSQHPEFDALDPHFP
jgi:LysM repeat protein